MPRRVVGQLALKLALNLLSDDRFSAPSPSMLATTSSSLGGVRVVAIAVINSDLISPAPITQELLDGVARPLLRMTCWMAQRGV